MDIELLIGLIGITTDNEITADDETTKELAEDNFGVVSYDARLELITMDRELIISLVK